MNSPDSGGKRTVGQGTGTPRGVKGAAGPREGAEEAGAGRKKEAGLRGAVEALQGGTHRGAARTPSGLRGRQGPALRVKADPLRHP